MRPGISACLIMLAGIAVLTRAQSDIVGEVRTENGMHRAAFRVPQGVIRVNFPDDLSVGDTISGSVYLEPSGKDGKELARNSGDITGYVVEMPGRKTETSERRFGWSVPAKVAGGVVPVVLLDKKNKIVSRCNLPVSPVAGGPGAPEIDLPLGSQAGSLVPVRGPFDSPGETSVTVGGREAAVVAESPRKIVFQTPENVLGESTLQVRKGPASAAGPFYVLGLQTSVNRDVLSPGETATMTAVVSGLQGLKEPASLVIVNHDTSVVVMAGGPVQHIAIQPSAVSPSGTFAFTNTLTGVRRGRFDITVVAARAPSGEIPVERIAGHSVDAWSSAQGVLVSPDARALILSGVAAARPELDRLLAPQLAHKADLGNQIDWLVRSYCFDLRDRKLANRPLGNRLPPLPQLRLNAFFQQPPPGAVPSRAPLTLEAQDVRRFTFSQFLAQILQRLTPSDPLGNLLVTSRPDRQTIRIDQVAGADYFTTRNFVLSVGKHIIAVASCQQSVTVNANQQTTVSCPP